MFNLKDFDAALAAIDEHDPSLLSCTFAVNGIVYGGAASTAERLRACSRMPLEEIAVKLGKARAEDRPVYVAGRRVTLVVAKKG